MARRVVIVVTALCSLVLDDRPVYADNTGGDGGDGLSPRRALQGRPLILHPDDLVVESSTP